MENILEIKNLNLSFEINDKLYPCLKDVSMNLKKNTFYALVGESGCGKSILTSSIIGLIPKNAKITSGEILFNNENILENNTQKKLRGRKIAYIPQDPMTSLNPLWTIENQMMEVLDLEDKLSKEEKREKIIEALNLVQIKEPEKRLKSYPHELSGGMRQRVIIAMALLTSSEIIIADEPTTALDVTIQAQILDILKDIQKLGKTILFITHNLGLVYKYADIASVMYLGEIVEEQSAVELIRNPKHPYTKALLDAIPKKDATAIKNIKGSPSPIIEVVEGCLFNKRCDIADEFCTKNHPNFNGSVRCFKAE